MEWMVYCIKENKDQMKLGELRWDRSGRSQRVNMDKTHYMKSKKIKMYFLMGLACVLARGFLLRSFAVLYWFSGVLLTTEKVGTTATLPMGTSVWYRIGSNIDWRNKSMEETRIELENWKKRHVLWIISGDNFYLWISTFCLNHYELLDIM